VVNFKTYSLDELDKADIKDQHSELPYGVWRRHDGSEVLFNRSYSPLYERASTYATDNICPHPVGRWVWINDIDKEIFFYNDSCSPNRKDATGRETIKRCMAVKDAFFSGGVIDMYAWDYV
jgi:hypothetical protein